MKNALKTALGALKTHGIGLGLFIAIAAIILSGLSSAEKAGAEEQTELLRDSISRAVVSCYALEGGYPESLQYLVEHYNVRIDESKFIVYYTIFASNIMPDIDIIVRDGADGGS
ncbi:MAG: hypothetical protein LBC28_04815 [Oscillospiraceae bacterium]|jgi:hypothetical protein|nr:hypothetical protein [Oscillospiraceae bacterium]